MEKRVCKLCGEEKVLSDFTRAGVINDKVYYRYKCKKCYHATKDKRRNRHMQLVREMKESIGCVRCGIKDQRCLDFDHIDRKTKSFSLGDLQGRSKVTILKEIDKCQVLCANCHRIKTWEESHESGDNCCGSIPALEAGGGSSTLPSPTDCWVAESDAPAHISRRYLDEGIM